MRTASAQIDRFAGPGGVDAGRAAGSASARSASSTTPRRHVPPGQRRDTGRYAPTSPPSPVDRLAAAGSTG